MNEEFVSKSKKSDNATIPLDAMVSGNGRSSIKDLLRRLTFVSSLSSYSLRTVQTGSSADSLRLRIVFCVICYGGK